MPIGGNALLQKGVDSFRQLPEIDEVGVVEKVGHARGCLASFSDEMKRGRSGSCHVGLMS
jgi:hypothetical protein